MNSLTRLSWSDQVLSGLMTPTTVNIYEAKTKLSQLIERAYSQGEEIIIAKAGKPRVKLVPVKEEKDEVKLGTMRGRIWMSPDFDDPIPGFEPYMLPEHQ